MIADTHMHLYPCYDTAAALRIAGANLRRLGGAGTPRLVLLAERHDCRFFETLGGGAPDAGNGWAPAGEPGVLVRDTDGAEPLYLVAGRQVVTAERIEILALALEHGPADGRPAKDTLRAIAEADGVPVLSWAPGKWFGARGRLVRELLETLPPDACLVGDTTLRPYGWGEPALMRLARQRGFGVAAGSDPLPFAGEEAAAGRYATRIKAPLDPSRPLAGLRAALRQPHALRTTGRRDMPWRAFRRLWLNALSKRR
jgi:hypothetical protein